MRRVLVKEQLNLKPNLKVRLWVLFGAIFAIGVLARVWAFGLLPSGLNKDETSIGVEAYDLLHYGVDRSGVSYPVHFISWGSGDKKDLPKLIFQQ
jgi:hypothetical protein